MGKSRRSLTLLSLLLLAPVCAHAQQDVRGYSLSLAGASRATLVTQGGAFALERLRIMSTPALESVKFELAAEAAARYSADTAAFSSLGTAATRGDYLPLDAWLARKQHTRSNVRFDRLNASLTRGKTQLTIGRQAISWATTLFLTPADPFAPFDPADPFREYRTGVDGVRLQFYPSAHAEWDAVYRPAKFGDNVTNTALVRAHRSVGAWDLGAWGGVLHDRTAAALQMTGTMAGSALRSEVELRRRSDTNGWAWRSSIGVDRRVTLAQRDLYVVLELMHDDLGARTVSALPAAQASIYAQRGELQVFGRDAAAAEAQWQVHPLLSTELVMLTDLRDGSMLFSPALVCSTGENTSLRAGGYFARGSGFTAGGLPRSQFGGAPATVFLALSVFF